MSEKDHWQELAEQLGLQPAAESERRPAAPAPAPAVQREPVREPVPERVRAEARAEPPEVGGTRRIHQEMREMEYEIDEDLPFAEPPAAEEEEPWEDDLMAEAPADAEEPAPEEEPRPERRERGGRRRGRRRGGRSREVVRDEVEERDEAEEEVEDVSPPPEEEEEELDTLSDWNVPSWSELIASLYRPER